MKKKTEHGKSAPSTGACTRLEYGIIYTLIGVAIIVVIFAISWLLIGRDKKNPGERGMAMETTLVENAANYSQPIQEESRVLEKDSNSINSGESKENIVKEIITEISVKKGDRGEKGDKGERGDIGLPGEKGAMGATGEKGDPGASGPQGDRGERGIQGAKGDQGEIGEKGDPGIDGKDGLDGADGKDGRDGQDAKDLSGDLENLKQKIDKVDSKFGGISFKKNSANGRYGYVGDDGQFYPFRNPAGTATEPLVLAGATFANSESDELIGSMPNHAGASKQAVGQILDEGNGEGIPESVFQKVNIPEEGYYSTDSDLIVDSTDIYNKGRNDYINRLIIEKGDPINHLVFLEDSGKRVASTTSIGVANAHCSATEVMFNPGYNTVIAIKGSSSGGKQSETISVSRYESAGAVYTDEQGNKENAKLIGYLDARAQNSVSSCVCDITGWKYIKLSKVAVFNNAAVTSGSTEEFFVFTTLPVSVVIDNIENYYQIWGN